VLIPATRRPDGTWRKERRVRAGYVPPDEVPLYESKGKKIVREIENIGIPGWVDADGQSSSSHLKKTKAQRKNEKRNLNRKTPITPTTTITTTTQTPKPTKNETKTESSQSQQPTAITSQSNKQIAVADNQQQEITKKIKAAKKKLKQIEELEEKLKTGGVKANEDQLTKLNRKASVEEEIKQLESQLSMLRV